MGRKYARIYVLGHYLFLVPHSFYSLGKLFASRNRSAMSADKCLSIFSRQMEAVVYIFYKNIEVEERT